MSKISFRTPASQSLLANVKLYLRFHPRATKNLVAQQFGIVPSTATEYLRAVRGPKRVRVPQPAAPIFRKL